MAYLKRNAFVITDVAQYTVKQAKELIQEFREKYPEHKGLAKRTDKSYLNEWAVHAVAFRWGIMTEKTKDADMQFVIEPVLNFIYGVFGSVARLILKSYH